ncbi:hypothetical protein B296_00001255 [Ensete ventricosum]|uniref:Uncharacterized protein n=1 Tax=Ensete ventricosum TaxID=4639 RepID=A0A427BAD9_ENSVE|nr:hypothetical protein B296_00001255 [Ensete ventricosum]
MEGWREREPWPRKSGGVMLEGYVDAADGGGRASGGVAGTKSLTDEDLEEPRPGVRVQLRGDSRALQHAPGAGALLLDEPEILGRATTTSFLLGRVIHGSVPVAPVSSP